MAEGFPHRGLLAESLRSHDQFIYTRFQRTTPITHPYNLVMHTPRVYLQNLDCDIAPLMLAHPHVSEPTPARCSFRPIVGK